MSSRLFGYLLIGSLCVAVILGGCGESEKKGDTVKVTKAAELSLAFVQGDTTTTYKSTIEN